MIFQQLKHQLGALSKLLDELNDQQYAQKIAHLSNTSIGEHSRHIIELLQCATEGHSTGTVDYLNRKRDLTLETNRLFAQEVILKLDTAFVKPNKELKLLIEQTEASSEHTISTNYHREIVYNTDHAIHHLALIKVALHELKLDLVDKNFGMAYSTIKYRATITASS